jgi:O-antigen/teichoic acid export membrane protein
MSFINKKDEARILFGIIFKYFLFAYGTLALIFFLTARPIVFLMTAEPFHSAYTVAGLVACAYVLKACYLIMLPGLYYEKQLHIQTTIEWVGAMVNVGLNFLLIPLLQKEGAAIATVLSYVSLTVLVYFMGNKFLQVKYDWKNIGKFVVAFSVLATVFSIQLTESIWLNVGLNGSLFIAFCGLVYIFMLTSNERGAAINLVTRVRPRFFFINV